MSQAQYSNRSPAVVRLMREARELAAKTDTFHAHPVNENLFEWHFSIRGADGTPFEGGIYHGRITLPAEYPMKPPNIIMLTPNGRFQLGTKICLSISGYHPETWQPSWSIRTALIAMIGFMPTPGHGAIGSLDYDDHERKQLAQRSLDWKCDTCGVRMRDDLLPAAPSTPADDGANDTAAVDAPDTPADDAAAPSAPTPPTPPRVRRRRVRRTPARRANEITSASIDLPPAPTNWSAVLLNALIVVVVCCIGVLLYRRVMMADGGHWADLVVLNTAESTQRTHDVAPQAPPTPAAQQDDTRAFKRVPTV